MRISHGFLYTFPWLPYVLRLGIRVWPRLVQVAQRDVTEPHLLPSHLGLLFPIYPRCSTYGIWIPTKLVDSWGKCRDSNSIHGAYGYGKNKKNILLGLITPTNQILGIIHMRYISNHPPDYILDATFDMSHGGILHCVAIKHNNRNTMQCNSIHDKWYNMYLYVAHMCLRYHWFTQTHKEMWNK